MPVTDTERQAFAIQHALLAWLRDTQSHAPLEVIGAALSLVTVDVFSVMTEHMTVDDRNRYVDEFLAQLGTAIRAYVSLEKPTDRDVH